MSDPRLVVVADLHGLAAAVPELRALLDELARGSRAEPGCESFRVLRSEEAADFVLLSAWADEGAMRAHYDTLHYRHYRDTVGPLLARPSDVVVHHVSTSTYPRDPNPPDPSKFD